MTVRECPQLPQSRIILSARIRSRRPGPQELGHLGFRSNAFRLAQLGIGCSRQLPERGKPSGPAGATGDEFLVLDWCSLFNRDDRRNTGISPRHRSLIDRGRHRCPICIRPRRHDLRLGSWNDGWRGIFKGRSLASSQNKCRKQAKRRTDFSLRVHVLFRSSPSVCHDTDKKMTVSTTQ